MSDHTRHCCWSRTPRIPAGRVCDQSANIMSCSLHWLQPSSQLAHNISYWLPAGWQPTENTLHGVTVLPCICIAYRQLPLLHSASHLSCSWKNISPVQSNSHVPLFKQVLEHVAILLADQASRYSQFLQLPGGQQGDAQHTSQLQNKQHGMDLTRPAYSSQSQLADHTVCIAGTTACNCSF